MRIVAGKYRGKKLFSPQDNAIRPTSDRSREAIFNILNSKLSSNWTDYNLSDVFDGSGAFGLEAISRGINSVIFIDINPNLVRKNAALFPLEKNKIKIMTADATNLPRITQKINLAFLDAPYNKELSKKTLESLHNKEWLDDEAICIVETEKKEKILAPNCFELIDERVYGLAKFSFFVYHK